MSKPEGSKRRHSSPVDRVAILKRHLLEGGPVSDLGDEVGITTCDENAGVEVSELAIEDAETSK